MFLCASSVTNMLWLHTIYTDVFKGYLFLYSLNSEIFVEITNGIEKLLCHKKKRQELYHPNPFLIPLKAQCAAPQDT